MVVDDTIPRCIYCGYVFDSDTNTVPECPECKKITKISRRITYVLSPLGYRTVCVDCNGHGVHETVTECKDPDFPIKTHIQKTGCETCGGTGCIYDVDTDQPSPDGGEVDE